MISNDYSGYTELSNGLDSDGPFVKNRHFSIQWSHSEELYSFGLLAVLTFKQQHFSLLTTFTVLQALDESGTLCSLPVRTLSKYSTLPQGGAGLGDPLLPLPPPPILPSAAKLDITEMLCGEAVNSSWLAAPYLVFCLSVCPYRFQEHRHGQFISSSCTHSFAMAP